MELITFTAFLFHYLFFFSKLLRCCL